MRQPIRKFLHDIVSELLGLPGKKVIWANQVGPKQADPLVTLRAYSEQAEAMAEQRLTRTPGEIDLRTPTEFVLEVQYFGGAFPVDGLSLLVRQLERPTIVDRFLQAGVAFLYADVVQDLTGLLENDQQFEPRAAVDIHFRYTSQVMDGPGYIDEVDAVIDVEGRVEIAGKLIHGDLIHGEEPDLDHALDVDFSCSAKE